MKQLIHTRSLYIGLAATLIGGAAILLFLSGRNNNNERVFAVVEEGLVRQVVSVSGSVRAENTAELGFPVGGTVKTVAVRKGDYVEAGTVLVALDAASLEAQVLDAQAAVAAAQANLSELRNGATNETLAVQNETVLQKRQNLERVRTDEALTVKTALRTLRSDALAAYTTDANEDAPAPVITGTYLCDREGTYTLSLYRSGAASGYSFRLSGLESGTFPVSNDQPIAFGTCGLRAQFDMNSSYHNTIWEINIPNTKSASYIANKNAYELALTNQKSAVERAERELAVAEAEAAKVAAPARNEAVERESAELARANAQLARAVANRNETTIVAPFAGTIVEVTAVPGESVATGPVVTLLALDRLELTARIPEVDIGKLTLGQKAEVYFDTAATTRYDAAIDFISPRATEIDGVAYYEARLTLADVPPWIRSGLNADISIIISEATGPRLPKRFISEVDGTYSVRTTIGKDLATTTIDITLMGNDGYVAIGGVPTGTTVVAP